MITFHGSHTSDDSGKNWREVLKSTKDKVEEKMKVGMIDFGFSLEDNNESIRNWLNSVFDEETYSSIFGDAFSNFENLNEFNNDTGLTGINQFQY
ncbi:unnamed protein product [Ambrosiozyma monospora]|uniref:Unnamed protein product n=1 Tax=Ambrosiozyma monospora TaxID=43982 RepID=A0ACB5UCT6_AMBMO|nr:unnamed protein product [Ambrosiozyma monospora]